MNARFLIGNKGYKMPLHLYIFTVFNDGMIAQVIRIEIFSRIISCKVVFVSFNTRSGRRKPSTAAPEINRPQRQMTESNLFLN